MRCIKPLRASQNSHGDVVYSSWKAEKGLVGFELECRKCIPCRLNMAREKAVRALHEADTWPDSIFLTLTYADEHLDSPRLDYGHFQAFMKSLLEKLNRHDRHSIPFMVTGEYGDKNKRPHWHALLFNYRPRDAVHKYWSDRGDEVWESKEIDSLWKKGMAEFGSVTIDSAGYVARYAAKKLAHGKDQDHDFHPIHNTSKKHAIGKRWIEKYYLHTFENGFVVLPNGQPTKIPRYYVDWCKRKFPLLWRHYVTQVRPEIMAKAELKARKEEMEYLSEVMSCYEKKKPYPLTRAKVKETCLKAKFKTLQERLKL